jgi:DNA repair exonuclease SbcCD ATPase subunit
MHEIRIAELELRNFKGVTAFALEPHGLDVAIYGDNATGKTTLADAFSWLLFGVDSSGAAEFDIKTLEAGEPIHNLEHEVRAELILTGAVRLELRKVYKEVWTKRRGEADKTFTGHTVDHYVDGVPVKKTEYDARLIELADINLDGFRILTDPVHFSERVHWQERRALVLELGGELTDADVIRSNEELEELPELLGKRTIEDARKVLTAERRRVNKELERVPIKIGEARRSIPEEVPDTEAVRTELEAARLALSELDAERLSTAEGGAIAAGKEAEAMARAELVEAETAARQEDAGAAEELARQESHYAAAVITLGQEHAKASDKLERANRELATAIEHRDALRARWDLVDGEDYGDLEDKLRPASSPERDHELRELAELLEAAKAEPVSSCPTCHQALPESMVEEASAKALERFNTAKSKALEDITERGRNTAETITNLEASIPDLEAELTKAADNLAGAETALEEAKERSASEAPGEPKSSEAIDAARETLKAAEAATLAAREGVSALLAKLDDQIKEAKAEVDVLQAKITAGEAAAKAEARVSELETELSELGAELARLEHGIYLLEMFTRAKVALLEDRINAKFRTARFRLFRELVNGALEECCETVCDGVPWSSANHGARIQHGMDIIQTLQAHYGIRPPVWVDQSESITTLPAMDSQLIRLVVSADDAELRVTTAAADAADQ